MGSHFHFLQQMYNEILSGLPLAKDSCRYTALLDPLVASQYSSAETESPTEKCLSSSGVTCLGDSSALDAQSPEISAEPGTNENVNQAREITLLQLTLMEIMTAKVQDPQVAAGTKQKYLDIIRTLVKEASIDTKLIFLLGSPDKLLSHMACKSLVSLVHFQLVEEGSWNNSWLMFCWETLSGFPSSTWTAECLWTLTNTVREILKDDSVDKGGELKKLFSPLDGLLERFYHRILSQASALPDGVLASAECTNNLSGFLDFLELLVASRSQTAVASACQRMLFLYAAEVLALTTSPVHAFVKKKSVVLLKRCVLCRAGEDLVTGKVPPSSLRDPHLEEDRVVFANAVLRFVESGWLSRAFVGEKADRFAGSPARPELEICRGPDDVSLRALSLVLLKALEIGVQNSTLEREAQALLESVMGPLLSFLKNHLGADPRGHPSDHPSDHPCAWLSKLFIEQDDDMFEAAKALLRVHLQFKRSWPKAARPPCLSEAQIWTAPTHRHGCNPHCIFLFLLQSVAFDASVLLDFLISSETCFLEYLVRYLKLLAEDWHCFAAISEGLEPTTSGSPSFSSKNSGLSQVNAESALGDPEDLLTSSENGTAVRQFDNRAVKPGRLSSLRESNNTSSRESAQRLVDYDSSEDSEIEEVCLADKVQTPLNTQACSTEGLAEIMECDTAPPGTKDLTVLPPSWSQTSPGHPMLAEGLLWKSVKCLQELHKSVSRLHRRNLFPYNPAALLKLLGRVDAVCTACKSMPDSSPLCRISTPTLA